MGRLNKRGLNAQVRPSGHNIKTSFSRVDPGGSIPANVVEEEIADDLLTFGNNAANDLYTRRCKEAGLKIHPARFPAALPDFFLRLVTDAGDLVLDPFAGSNTTGAVGGSISAGSPWRSTSPIFGPAGFGSHRPCSGSGNPP